MLNKVLNLSSSVSAASNWLAYWLIILDMYSSLSSWSLWDIEKNKTPLSCLEPKDCLIPPYPEYSAMTSPLLTIVPALRLYSYSPCSFLVIVPAISINLCILFWSVLLSTASIKSLLTLRYWTSTGILIILLNTLASPIRACSNVPLDNVSIVWVYTSSKYSSVICLIVALLILALFFSIVALWFSNLLFI